MIYRNGCATWQGRGVGSAKLLELQWDRISASDRHGKKYEAAIRTRVSRQILRLS